MEPNDMPKNPPDLKGAVTFKEYHTVGPFYMRQEFLRGGSVKLKLERDILVLISCIALITPLK
jgi:hypothetical protein